MIEPPGFQAATAAGTRTLMLSTWAAGRQCQSAPDLDPVGPTRGSPRQEGRSRRGCRAERHAGARQPDLRHTTNVPQRLGFSAPARGARDADVTLALNTPVRPGRSVMTALAEATADRALAHALHRDVPGRPRRAACRRVGGRPGLFVPGLYRDDPAWIRQARAADLVTLFAVAPVLAFSLWRARRGSAVAWRLAALGYLVYNYSIFGFSVAINPMTPVHLAVLGISTWALVLALMAAAGSSRELAPGMLPSHDSGPLRRRRVVRGVVAGSDRPGDHERAARPGARPMGLRQIRSTHWILRLRCHSSRLRQFGSDGISTAARNSHCRPWPGCC